MRDENGGGQNLAQMRSYVACASEFYEKGEFGMDVH
jgi:hypothetical protein